MRAPYTTMAKRSRPVSGSTPNQCSRADAAERPERRPVLAEGARVVGEGVVAAQAGHPRRRERDEQGEPDQHQAGHRRAVLGQCRTTRCPAPRQEPPARRQTARAARTRGPFPDGFVMFVSEAAKVPGLAIIPSSPEPAGARSHRGLAARAPTTGATHAGSSGHSDMRPSALCPNRHGFGAPSRKGCMFLWPIVDVCSQGPQPLCGPGPAGCRGWSAADPKVLDRGPERAVGVASRASAAALCACRLAPVPRAGLRRAATASPVAGPG